MRKELSNIEKIDLYLTNQLEQTQKAEFEEALKQNTALEEQVTEHQLVLQAIKRSQLKKEILAIANGTRFWNFWTKLGLGFSFIGILILAITLLPNEKPNNIVKESKSVIEKTNPNQVISTPDITSDSINQQDSSSTAFPKSNFTKVLQKNKRHNSHTSYKEDTECGGLKTFVVPNKQLFKVQASTGKTIEGEQGTLIIIPPNAFIDKKGNNITGTVDFELVEALTLEDMILYNLTTTSNGKQLETGGMFYMNATLNGSPIAINPVAPIYTETPTDNIKKGMLAFDSEIDSSGNINWITPKPLKKYLTKIDLALLNFLPEGFANGVEEGLPYKNYKNLTNELVDSLYYTLGQDKTTEPLFDSITNNYIPKRKLGIRWGADKFIGFKKKRKVSEGKLKFNKQLSAPNGTFPTNNLMEEKKEIICGINPLSIKTIKKTEFEQTYLATKEMEERISYLHQLDNGDSLLNVYIENLGNDLYIADSIVASSLTGKNKDQFDTFYKQKLTNLKDVNNIYQQQLSAYYIKKKKQYVRELSEFKKTLAQKNQEEITRLHNLILQNKKDFQKANQPTISPRKTLTSSIGRLANKVPQRSVASVQSYPAQWASFGWKNIDKYTHLLANGYETVEIGTNIDKGFSRVFQYLNTIKTITPLMLSNNIAKANFPKKGSSAARQMNNTYCFNLTKKDGKYFWGKQHFNPYTQNKVIIETRETSLATISQELKIAGEDGAAAFNYFEEAIKQESTKKKRQAESKARLIEEQRKRDELFKIYEAKQAKLNAEIERKRQEQQTEFNFMEILKSIAFPCYKLNSNFKSKVIESPTASNTNIEKVSNNMISQNGVFNFSTIESKPEFPGGATAIMQYIANNVNYPKEAAEKEISGKVIVQFIINEEGKITTPTIIK